MQPLLHAEHVNKHYEGTRALQDASFSVLPGEVHALVGENGAGKSTLSKIIAGVVQPDTADIRWKGETVPIASPLQAQQLGIGIVFQELDLFPSLSIAENLVIGNLQVERRPFVNWRELVAFCSPFLHQVALAINPRTRVGDLRMAEMQLVSIARALSFKAHLILMDEPTSSLSDDAVERLFLLIRQLKTNGVSIVYVSHKMKEISEISDRITVLRDGATIGTRNTRDTNLDEIINMMVGRELAARAGKMGSQPGELFFSVEHLHSAKIRDISFHLHRGEILGVAGLVGAGRSELGAALFGLDRLTAGTIRLNGRDILPRSPQDAIRAGLGLLPEDRKLEGLMMQMSVVENTTMASLARFQSLGFIHRRKEMNESQPVHKRIRLRSSSDKIQVGTLSGGNQQKVLFSKWLLADPEVLFLDDSTRGIDIGAKQDIYAIVEDLAKQGKGIIFVSSELPELLQNCHRILVMCEGECTGIVDARSTTQEQIMALATLHSTIE
ncbi:MAG TPA: sugar ABC transporter ATP-binding protein [Candidatus Acidoferrales bacterium]|nr:sugar ABC transporter ATP-binding protein [Candidatus Acidoferrales bacterium]